MDALSSTGVEYMELIDYHDERHGGRRSYEAIIARRMPPFYQAARPTEYGIRNNDCNEAIKYWRLQWLEVNDGVDYLSKFQFSDGYL